MFVFRLSMVPNRRNLVLGAACLGSLGAAEVLKPRRHMSLLGGRKLADVIPRSFGTWSSLDVTDLVAPREENSLASKLYGQTVGRSYVNADSRFEVMMLAAHGETQSRDLQVHRPETCYPAVGFSVSETEDSPIALASGAVLGARQLVAEAIGRRESIVYWARVGEFFPQTGFDQRLDILRMAMSGYISDGLLMRISALGDRPAEVFPALHGFVGDLLTATAPAVRPALIGERLSEALPG
jgi:EpsI family protein